MAYKPPTPAYLEFEGSPLYFDVVEKEGLRHSATTTDHPVEKGADVSDHVRDMPDEVTLEVFFSNSPIKDVNDLYNGRVAGLDLKVPKAEKQVAIMPGAALNAGLDALSDFINGPQQWKAMTLQFPEKFDNVAFVLSSLLDWKTRGVLGKVITPHRTYESVVIIGVESNRDAGTGDGCPITISLKSIRLVEAKLITAPVPTEERGKTLKSKGRQPTSFVRDPPKKKSIFKKLLGG